MHPHDFQQCYGFNMWAGFLDGCVIGPYLLPPNLTGNAFPGTHTAWALGRCATARSSKHVVWLWWHITSFYSCSLGSCGSKIWANLDRSWGPDCLACMFTWPDSAKLLTVGPHEELGLLVPCGVGYGCSGCWTTRYWWSCVREHSTVYALKSLIIISNPSYNWTQNNNNVQ